jgi:hypothetical protein
VTRKALVSWYFGGALRLGTSKPARIPLEVGLSLTPSLPRVDVDVQSDAGHRRILGEGTRGEARDELGVCGEGLGSPVLALCLNAALKQGILFGDE